MRKLVFSLSMLCFSLIVTAQKALDLSASTEGIFRISSGHAMMTIDAMHGGKVVSLKLDERELLAQHRRVEGMRFENMNDYGSTFWPSPQSAWNWPPIATYDSQPYSVTTTDNTLILTSDKDDKYPYVFVKTFLPLGDGNFSITYTIKNESDTIVRVAPWEITRVPSGGEVFFEASSLRPENEVAYTEQNGVIRIPFTPERKNRKIFADACGWLSFQNDGLLFTKRFADITHEQAAPGEEEVEVYWNFGTTYIEIENQGEYVAIPPHDSHSWTVVWELSAVVLIPTES